MKYLNVPGIGSSGPEHWQTLWENKNPDIGRITVADWDQPDCKIWMKGLENAVQDAVSRSRSDDVDGLILIGHSLGCLLIAHWVQNSEIKSSIKGALLVAPPDPSGPEFPDAATGFAPVPTDRFPFQSIVLASENDPYSSIEFAENCAKNWGSKFVSVGEKTHINAASGLGFWQQGYDFLSSL